MSIDVKLRGVPIIQKISAIGKQIHLLNKCNNNFFMFYMFLV